VTRPGERPPIPTTQVLGGAVLDQGPAVLLVLTALGVYERSLKLNGVQPSPLLLSTQRNYAVAASVIYGQSEPVSAGPSSDVRTSPTPSVLASPEWIGTSEVASVLEVTERHARRLAATLDARRIRGSWLFHRQAVEDYLAGHDNRRDAA